MISTIAGDGFSGFSGDGGPAISARVRNVVAMAVDSHDYLYLSDHDGRIRKISGGKITTVAGNGPLGPVGDGGPATTATLQLPVGIAFDSSDNLYIAEFGRIRKVSAGIISPVVGTRNGDLGDGGPAATARIDQPSSLVFDRDGNLYIGEYGIQRVRKVVGGVITNVAGNGNSSFSGEGGLAVNAQLTARAVAVDKSGNLYVAAGGQIEAVTGEILRPIAGTSGADSVAVDVSGDLYVTKGAQILKLSNGELVPVAGTRSPGYSGDGGLATSAQFRDAQRMAFDRLGNLYIADTGNHRVRKISGGIITTVAGTGVAGYSGDNGPATNAQLYLPTDVAVDSEGNLYIVDSANRIRKVSADGIITTVTGGLEFFSGANSIAVDIAGTLYVAYALGYIRKFSDGMVTTVAGTGEAGYSGDVGPAIKAQLNNPVAIAVDDRGHLYIAESGRVRMLTVPVPVRPLPR
jgi:sugar lactone lactonase YvrE